MGQNVNGPPSSGPRGAGALSVAIYNAFAAWLVRRWMLPRSGRRSDLR